jgi:hypothetical protein
MSRARETKSSHLLWLWYNDFRTKPPYVVHFPGGKMEGTLYSGVELPLAFQLLDPELLRNTESHKGIMDAYNKNVDLARRGKSHYGRGVAACEALMLFFLQSGDHGNDFIEALFPPSPSEPEMVPLTSMEVTRLSAPLSASLKVSPEFALALD